MLCCGPWQTAAISYLESHREAAEAALHAQPHASTAAREADRLSRCVIWCECRPSHLRFGLRPSYTHVGHRSFPKR